MSHKYVGSTTCPTWIKAQQKGTEIERKEIPSFAGVQVVFLITFWITWVDIIWRKRSPCLHCKYFREFSMSISLKHSHLSLRVVCSIFPNTYAYNQGLPTNTHALKRSPVHPILSLYRSSFPVQIQSKTISHFQTSLSLTYLIKLSSQIDHPKSRKLDTFDTFRSSSASPDFRHLIRRLN